MKNLASGTMAQVHCRLQRPDSAEAKCAGRYRNQCRGRSKSQDAVIMFGAMVLGHAVMSISSCKFVAMWWRYFKIPCGISIEQCPTRRSSFPALPLFFLCVPALPNWIWRHPREGWNLNGICSQGSEQTYWNTEDEVAAAWRESTTRTQRT